MTSGDAAGRLLAAVQGAALAPEVVAASNAPAPDPEAGQLWRAAWQGVAEMILVAAVGPEMVTVLPVTLDEGFDDVESLTLPADATGVGSPLTVWAGLRRHVPLFVLDRHLGTVAAGWEAQGASGRAITNPADPRAEFRARLSDTLNELSAASWVPAGAGSLGRVLREAGVKAAQVADALGSSPQEALALLRSELPVTPEQAATLGRIAGMDEAELLAANPAPPADLVARLNRPRRKRQVLAVAARAGTDELTARRTIAFESGRFAARQTGPSSAPAWDERLDQYFAAKLDG